ncbi:MAG: PhzF family phenazine biosynthesis isomerase [Actinobacteria bacterium]|nr:PhzF family phenazine biosynthesis isomerase [Actinomycetota bacterium]
MEFFQVDVFADRAYEGNPLAVFPDCSDVSSDQMQAIAHEMNLSETTFVTEASGDSYRVRIFTPHEELPFAGHPTLGTAWVLRELGLVSGDVYYQHSGAEKTKILEDRGMLWFERNGRADPDLEDSKPTIRSEIAEAIGLVERDLDLQAREIGRPGLLRPGVANAGLEQLMIPVRDLETLARCVPRVDRLAALPALGVYVFTAVKAGGLRSRGFFPGVGVPEDPGTGSAAAALGLYLARRLGKVDFEVVQGVEVGRPCRIHLSASDGVVRIGGACSLVLRGTLERLP